MIEWLDIDPVTAARAMLFMFVFAWALFLIHISK